MTTARSGNDHPAYPSREMAGEQMAVTHAEMDNACDRGEAVPLARSITWLMRYRQAWWVVFEKGWLRIHDDLVAPDLDRISARLSAAEEAADAARDVPEPGGG